MTRDSPLEPFGLRLVLVSLLPAFAAGAFLLVLIWAGAPGELSFTAAWRTAAGLKAGELVLLAVGLALVALVTYPMQVALVRVFEGYWGHTGAGRLSVLSPRRLSGWLARRLSVRLARRRDELAEREAQALTEEDEQAAGTAGELLRSRYPASGAVLPTRLGNVLAAAEERAGKPYGWDAVVAWPRLYPVLGAESRAVADDLRDSLDAMIRLSCTAAVTAPVSLALLWASGWWAALVLVPLVVAVLAYRAALQSALSYGRAMEAAFDLHRFDLLAALRLPLPADREAERAQAAALCALWRQGTPVRLDYDHGPVTSRP
ncbi:hypothetical protein OIE66_11305 [Nonomuraea sp. NBC_01738]|uniref:hypothetical protein n=1 Tax=Nonomuraea sp. NBC_01738 TaxID=2976003 RepID=UPI002E157045|nr:hypothetical protein OIE66_11305 [Nonomuraea sp. NBC_01738]